MTMRDDIVGSGLSKAKLLLFGYRRCRICRRVIYLKASINIFCRAHQILLSALMIVYQQYQLEEIRVANKQREPQLVTRIFVYDE